jgi:AsmA-like C-terminal region
VDGTYSFTNADLGTIKGISGTLSSTGKFGGALGEIGVVGTTDTPNFALDVSEHPVDLRTQFDATVDGTTGDTKLNSVHATLLHTVLDVNGMVMRSKDAQGVPGHLIDMAVTSDQARVEDLLRLGAKTSPPLMRGGLTLRAKLQIPPGHVSVSQKMRIEGTFAIHGATLSNAKWQQTVDKLSERASGNPEQANAQDAKRVTSDMSGDFSLANATLEIPKLNYQMPGANVDLAGKYSLDGKTFNFNGTVRTKATASQMLTGWKSILAMPLDPLLKKNGAGVEVPIKIDGTQSDPKFGVDLNKLSSDIMSRHKNNREQQETEPKP